MGVYYYAVDRERKISYELGKGEWHMLTEGHLGDDYNKIVVNDKLLAKLKEVTDDETAERVFNEMKIVFGAFRILTLENDASVDDLPDMELRGSRYTEKADGTPCIIDVNQWANK